MLFGELLSSATKRLKAQVLALASRRACWRRWEGDVQCIQKKTDVILKQYVWSYDRLDEIFR